MRPARPIVPRSALCTVLRTRAINRTGPSTHVLGYACVALRARISLTPATANTASIHQERHTTNMPHTYSSTLFHIVFSTKERRRPAIKEPPKLWAYLAGTARNLHYDPLAVGGTENHLHILLRLPAHTPIAEAAQKLKANSSRWLRENGAWFGWQEGYSAFSVSPSNIDAVRHYIQNQAEHHRRHSFEEEFLALLERAGIAFKSEEVFSEEVSEKG